MMPLPSAAQSLADEQVNVRVYERANPAVVTIRAGRSNGSGSIVSPEGLVLTNEHVVRGSAVVQVRTADGRPFAGEVIALDRRNDLALVRLETRGQRLPSIPLADPRNIRVGQRVFAIGAPFGLAGTLTTGILSRINPGNGDLQTDARLNPGNSGGPLLNSNGELVGVNKSIIVSRAGGNTGIGNATSAQVAREFISRNANNRGTGSVAMQPDRFSGRARLGITVNTENFVIDQVQPNSIASRVGLRPGDRLLGLNGQRLIRVEQLTQYLDQSPEVVVLTVQRDRRIANLRIRL
ncbi:MAG: trypsin-like serine protease [Oscillatoriales cyanobacterium SM2_2_1]|nr:trypsin-like serine protease [Oscillatoriales cyanobacterium SM2_2_1]